MTDTEQRVWVGTSKLKDRKTAYRLRWLDLATAKWRSKTVGTDKKAAERKAAELEGELAKGTYTDTRRVTWQEFAAEHVRLIPGEANRAESERALNEFGKLMGYPAPRRITFQTVEKFADLLRVAGKNTTATVNKKLRYLRAALKKAVRRGYIGRSPMDGWQFGREEGHEIRELTAVEERAILSAAEDLYGFRLRTFIEVALTTGGRRGEVTGLTWGRVDLDGGTVLFVKTKGGKDRRAYLDAETVADLRKLLVQTQQQGGPFVGLNANLGHKWKRILEKAKVTDLSIHDMRRTAISRWIRAGGALSAVKKLAGHASVATTEKYYINVNDADAKAVASNARKGIIVG